eukprot:4041178-Pyramimonas_sp.AAC.1
MKILFGGFTRWRQRLQAPLPPITKFWSNNTCALVGLGSGPQSQRPSQKPQQPKPKRSLWLDPLESLSH